MAKVICPKCLGSNTLMEPKKERGFEYKTCTLCRGSGYVNKELEQDFILSLNEDSINEDFEGL